jgi:hypothetical protein
MLNPQFFEPIYVRLEIELRWDDLMTVTVPWQKSNPDAVQPSTRYGPDGAPKGVSKETSLLLVNASIS